MSCCGYKIKYLLHMMCQVSKYKHFALFTALHYNMNWFYFKLLWFWQFTLLKKKLNKRISKININIIFFLNANVFVVIIRWHIPYIYKDTCVYMNIYIYIILCLLHTLSGATVFNCIFLQISSISPRKKSHHVVFLSASVSRQTVPMTQRPPLVQLQPHSKSSAAIVLATKEQSQQSWNTRTQETQKKSMLPFGTRSVCYFRISKVATVLLLLFLLTLV